MDRLSGPAKAAYQDLADRLRGASSGATVLAAPADLCIIEEHRHRFILALRPDIVAWCQGTAGVSWQQQRHDVTEQGGWTEFHFELPVLRFAAPAVFTLFTLRWL